MTEERVRYRGDTEDDRIGNALAAQTLSEAIAVLEGAGYGYLGNEMRKYYSIHVVLPEPKPEKPQAPPKPPAEQPHIEDIGEINPDEEPAAKPPRQARDIPVEEIPRRRARAPQ